MLERIVNQRSCDRSFQHHLRYWSGIAGRDPFFAILTDPAKQHNRWNEEAFFAGGRGEIESLMRTLEELDMPKQRFRALDFGCGLGRLSFPLARYFEHVEGVDIAPEMIRRAESRSTADIACTFTCHQSPDLSCYESASFDLVVSMITLQHMPPRCTLKYLSEFARVLKPGGTLVFQLFFGENPEDPLHKRIAHLRPSRWVLAYKAIRKIVMFDRKDEQSAPMAMHGIAPWTVAKHLARQCLAIVLYDDGKCGPEWLSYTYICRRGTCPIPMRGRSSIM